RQHILVLGDVMLDQYFWGSVSRVSPEAPVPVVEIASESIRLGGAANVANNIRSLEATPLLVGVIGNDGDGKRFLKEAQAQHISTEGLLIDSSRPTTIKTRVIAHHQHVLRTDRESKKPVNKKIEKRLIELIRALVPKADAILIQDYNKGTVTRGIIKEVTALARKRRKILAVDPKIDHFFDFVGATVFKPNQREVEGALGLKIGGEESLRRAGERILKRLGCSYLLITRGEQGMTLFERNGKVTHVATRAKEVYDVSGAGDTVMAVLTVALATGADITEAATLANHAAGLVCAEVGIVPVAREELLKAMKAADR
ncbi:MAG: D-glycero-beta-D-manno-heptose-7-phosphate kinase, partial [bacterium]